MEGIAESLIGHPCEALILEQYWYEANLTAPANVCWLGFCGSWYRLYLDAGSVHWTTSGDGPKSYDMPELDAEVTLMDLGNDFDLVRDVLTSYAVGIVDHGVEVSLGFESGKFVTLRNAADDTTTYRCTA